MKMSLSVVMGIVDKMKAPLQSISSNTNKYTKQIQALKASQADTSGQMAMIQTLKKTQAALKANKLDIDAAAEKLAKLEAKARAAISPSAQLTAQIAKQKAKLDKLNASQDNYRATLSATGKQLKTAGINTKQLDKEFDRLNSAYTEQAAKLEAVGKKYDSLLRRMKPVMSMANKIKLPTLDNAKNLMAASAAPVAGLGALGYIINDTANEINALSKAAREVNMPVDTMQALMLQATDAGAEADDMASAIREMALRWGEMKSLKSGAMHDYFKDTDNKAAFNNLMNAKDEAAAYQIIIDEIAKEADVSKRNFMMDEFFGGDSEKLIAVLGAGTKGLQDARNKLNSIGAAITDDEVDSADSYKTSLKDLQLIINSMKIKVLTPIIQKLSETFKRFSENMKNAKWRDDKIKQVSSALVATYNAITSLAKGISFIGKYWKEFVAGLALAKIAMIALNFAMLANPIGLIVAGVAAAGVAITYLISKFIGFGKITDWIKQKFAKFNSFVSNAINAVGNIITSMIDKFSGIKEKILSKIPSFNPFSFISEGVVIAGKYISDFFMQFSGINTIINNIKSAFVKFIGIIPQRLLPDSWKQNIDKLKAELDGVNNVNASADVNHTNENITKFEPVKYAPITTNQVQSKSEVSLRIQSDKPISVEKANSDNATNLDLDVGSMQFSY